MKNFIINNISTSCLFGSINGKIIMIDNIIVIMLKGDQEYLNRVKYIIYTIVYFDIDKLILKYKSEKLHISFYIFIIFNKYNKILMITYVFFIKCF